MLGKFVKLTIYLFLAEVERMYREIILSRRLVGQDAKTIVDLIIHVLINVTKENHAFF